LAYALSVWSASSSLAARIEATDGRLLSALDAVEVEVVELVELAGAVELVGDVEPVDSVD
jgi:hypothetical protein